MKVKIADCRRVVGLYYNIQRAQMIGASRRKAVARPRMMVMTLAHEFTGTSLPHIAYCLGGRDHTTVLSGIKRIRKLEGQDEAVRDQMAIFRRTLAAYAEGSA